MTMGTCGKQFTQEKIQKICKHFDLPPISDNYHKEKRKEEKRNKKKVNSYLNINKDLCLPTI